MKETYGICKGSLMSILNYNKSRRKRSDTDNKKRSYYCGMPKNPRWMLKIEVLSLVSEIYHFQPNENKCMEEINQLKQKYAGDMEVIGWIDTWLEHIKAEKTRRVSLQDVINRR